MPSRFPIYLGIFLKTKNILMQVSCNTFYVELKYFMLPLVSCAPNSFMPRSRGISVTRASFDPLPVSCLDPRALTENGCLL